MRKKERERNIFSDIEQDPPRLASENVPDPAGHHQDGDHEEAHQEEIEGVFGEESREKPRGSSARSLGQRVGSSECSMEEQNCRVEGGRSGQLDLGGSSTFATCYGGTSGSEQSLCATSRAGLTHLPATL